MNYKRVGKAAGAAIVALFVFAAVPATASAGTTTNWTGFNVGAFGGLLAGSNARPETTTSIKIPLNQSGKGFIGVRAGYDYQFPNAIVLGLYTDYERLYGKGSATPFDLGFGMKLTPTANTKSLFTVGTRLGYSVGKFLPYATVGYTIMGRGNAGYVLSGGSPPLTPISASTGVKLKGPTLGGGFEWMVVKKVSVYTEYRYSALRGDSDLNGNHMGVKATINAVTLGVNYHF